MVDIICPSVKGSDEGAVCTTSNEFIKNLKDADIDVCLSEHYGYCGYYRD